MKLNPPRWPDRFLEWYCRPELLEEIQGDAYELFTRRANKSIAHARFGFAWDVLRFFRWKNIRKRKPDPTSSNLTSAMIKNMFLVTLRNFMRQPGHSLLNLVGLSAGFTCAFLILLWVAQEFSYDRFHNEPDRLFRVLTHVQADQAYQTYDVASAAIDVSSIAEVEAIARVSTGSRWPHELCFRPEGNETECVYLHGVYSVDSFFDVFNFRIVRGDPHPLKGPAEIVISQKMAVALYGTDDAVGKIIKVDGTHEVKVSSVIADVPVNSTLQFDFIMPFSVLKKEWGVGDEILNSNFFNIYLKATAGTKAEELTPKLNDLRVLTQPLKDQHIQYQASQLTDSRLHGKFEFGKNTGGRIEYVRLFAIIALLVVLMAVINFVNMTTARASTRAKEIGVRKVTGALRSSIAAQFMGESFIMVLASFVVAVVLTHLTLPFFNTLLNEPVTLRIYSGWVPFALAGFLVLVAFVAGIYPALVVSAFQPIRILKNQITNHVAGSNRLRKSLLVVQLSVSIGIIVFSGVIYRQLEFIMNKDLGFDRQNMIRVEPTYKLLQKIDAFKAELAKTPSIVGVTTANMNPLQAGGGNTGVNWPGKPKEQRVSFTTIGVTSEFPETFNIKVTEGRNFLPDPQDTVNTEVLATQEAVKIMGLKNPVGEYIDIGETKCVIIGVVNDFHTGSLREARLPVILFRTSIFHTGTMFVKYQPGQTKQGLADLQKAYTVIEPSYTMKYWFQDDTFDSIYRTELTASKLSILFTVISLIIALIGIVGLSTFNVVRKTKEIGVRRVFGASPAQILSLLTKEFSWVMVVALVIATPVTWYATDKWLTSFAYHAEMPWWLYATAFFSIAALTISIICFQGMKAVVSNPTTALRSE